MAGKPRAFSGIQPTGGIHLGNYLGAIRNWVLQQDQYDNIFSIVDLHAMTIPYDPRELRQRTLEVGSVLLAAGIDPERSILFVQSDVREHTELCWILGTLATFGELRRMTQFKEKSKGTSASGQGCSSIRCSKQRTSCSTTQRSSPSVKTKSSTSS